MKYLKQIVVLNKHIYSLQDELHILVQIKESETMDNNMKQLQELITAKSSELEDTSQLIDMLRKL